MEGSHMPSGIADKPEEAEAGTVTETVRQAAVSSYRRVTQDPNATPQQKQKAREAFLARSGTWDVATPPYSKVVTAGQL